MGNGDSNMQPDNTRRAECATCALLRDCEEVTPDHIFSHSRCRLWQPADEPQLAARKSIIQDFGMWALVYSVPKLARTSNKRRKMR